jgi:hypothetical protein
LSCFYHSVSSSSVLDSSFFSTIKPIFLTVAVGLERALMRASLSEIFSAHACLGHSNQVKNTLSNPSKQGII